MSRGRANRAAVASLVLARIVYAINWLNLGAIFVLIGPDLGAGTTDLGTLTSTFYLGLGLMQIPAGLLAAKWGPKRVVLVGIFASSLAVLGTSYSTSVVGVAMLRFVVGSGMAFVFAPGVVLVAAHLGGRTGLGVGLFNSAYDIGGIIGIFGWVVVASFVGWRLSLALGGCMGMITAILVGLMVPGDSSFSEHLPARSSLFKILGDRQLILLGLATLGFSVGNVLVSGFMVEYLVRSLHYPAIWSGVIASMVVLLPIFTAIWGGRMYEGIVEQKKVVALVVAGSGLALLLCGIPNVYAALLCSILTGIFAGVGFTFAFAGAKDLNRAGAQYDGLAIAWVNGISLTGALVPPILYSQLVVLRGYSTAWEASAALCLIFLVPVLLLRRRFHD